MKVDIEYLKQQLKKEVKEYRYLHSLGVAETGKKLAKKYGADPLKVEIAGILHDFTKDWPKEKMASIIEKYDELADDLLNYDHWLWHGPVTSIVIQERFNINDQDIINAIRYHTFGREKMSLIEKIVCLADYIEPLRQFPGIDEVRSLAEQDLDKALLAEFDGTIQFLIKNKRRIYPLAVLTRNQLLEIIESKLKED